MPNIKVAIGVGGTFDYLAGKISRAPKWLRLIGLEWLFRLIKEPKRIRRIYNAIVKFGYLVIKQKMKSYV
jgi:N-acetylglucosaminyldiphosphoundecaprenol N-acetyl-beta-D-mannosaminyltransferase